MEFFIILFLLTVIGIGLGKYDVAKAKKPQAVAQKDDTPQTEEVKDYREFVLKAYYEKELKGIERGAMPCVIIDGCITVDPDTTEEEFYNSRLESLNNLVNSIKDNNYKAHIVFHGGCLSCIAPEMINVGYCNGCRFFNGNLDKSIELKDSHPGHNFENIVESITKS